MSPSTTFIGGSDGRLGGVAEMGYTKVRLVAVDGIEPSTYGL